MKKYAFKFYKKNNKTNDSLDSPLIIKISPDFKHIAFGLISFVFPPIRKTAEFPKLIEMRGASKFSSE